MSFNPGYAAWKLNYELSPIILNNGIANSIQGQMLPIISITEAINFTAGILDAGDNITLDNFFAHYQVIPGGTMIQQQIGKYPFANQAVAANAVISQPLTVSVLMICPVRQLAGYSTKLSIMMSLKSALEQHNASGGTYTIVTPSIYYPNCVMTGLSDVSNSESKQVQNAWRLDFEQPLLTQQSAEQAYNSVMGKIGAQVQSDGALSGPDAAFTPSSAMTPSIIGAAQNIVSGSTAFGPGLVSGLIR